MNFAERLTYWYLRLNGFFPIANFVLHHADDHRTSDADLIAVRFPHVSEETGGNPEDWDERFQNEWGIALAAETVGLIVEVKSGGWNPDDLTDPARAFRVRDGLKRIGMIPPGDELDGAIAALNRTPVTRLAGFTLGKLFVGNGGMPPRTPWLHLQLNDADAFVRERMRRYRERKLADRLFFSGDLIQYLAWKGGGDCE
jgi:hypothetical protein